MTSKSRLVFIFILLLIHNRQSRERTMRMLNLTAKTGYTNSDSSIDRHAMLYSILKMPISCLTYGATPALFTFSFSFSSIFRRAARIISSLRFCMLDCLSLRSWLHAFGLGDSSVGGCAVWPTLEDKLYRVIRSGCAGFRAGEADGACVVLERRGTGSWKDAGAWVQVR